MKKFTSILFAIFGTSSLIGCSSGGDGDAAGSGRGGQQNGFLNLSVTDAPIDGALAVWIQFDGVELKPKSGPAITVTFDEPMKLNLLELQGANSAQMLFNETLPAGEYNWIRLLVTAVDDGTLDSYIVVNTGSYDLDIPSGDETGLQIIGGLEVIPNTPTNMTIDFDLRQSITLTGTGQYKLSPVLRLIKDSETTSFSDTVDLALLTGPDCSDADPATGNAVYLFQGAGVTPDDVDNNDPEPIASALVKLNDGTGEYEYSFGFIPFGNYTSAFTCAADLDDPLTDDAIVFSNVSDVVLTTADVSATTR